MNSYGFYKVVRYVPRLLSAVFNLFPLSKIAVLVAIAGVVFEYATLSVMLMLSTSQSFANPTVIFVTSAWRHIIVSQLGMADEPKTWIWVFILMLGTRILLGFIQLGLTTWVSKRLLSHLSMASFARVLLKEPMAMIYKRSIGYYTAIAGDESARVGQVFFHLVQGLSALISALVGLLMIFVFSEELFVLTMLFLLLSGGGILFSFRRLLVWSNESMQLSRAANTTFIEAFNGIRSIRSMAGENFAVEQYGNQQRRYGTLLFYLDLMNHGSKTLPGLVLVLLALIVLYPTAGFIKEISPIHFFAAATMLIRVLSFLGAAVASGGRAAIDIRAAFDLDEIIAKPSGNHLPPSPMQAILSAQNISMSGLSCGYADSHPVLTDVSVQLRAGRCYALVGRSGSGKSTLSDVLLGLLPPMSGMLKIDNLPYDRIDMASLRRKVVLVEQQTRIFSGSVRDNIAFGLAPSDAEVQLAVEAAGLSEFISALPDGLDTRMDYQGANLSGGQRQRIGLARAIVRKPDVLILDEATSALDGQTRDMILQHLLSLFHDKILLFITHDNHIIQATDEVWHIKKGKLMIETKSIPA